MLIETECPRNRPAEGGRHAPVRPTPSRRSAAMCAVQVVGLVALLYCLPAIGGRAGTPLPVTPRRDTESRWLGHITKPVELSGSDWAELTSAVYAGLQNGRLAESLPAPAAADDGVRAVFLSSSTGADSATVFLGVGVGLREAVRTAFDRAAAALEPGVPVRWLKLDVVQYALPVLDFHIHRSPLPQPSLLGIAFEPFRRVALLPEQLVARDLTDAHGRLVVHGVGEQLAATERLSDALVWSKISAFRGGVPVYLFECESTFHDGQQCIPLFRGHRVYRDFGVTDLVSAATRAGDFMVRWCTETGEFAVPLAEWHTGPDGTPLLRDDAGAALALLALYKRTERRSFLTAAESIVTRLQGAIRPYALDPKAGCIVEYRLSSLDTNALAILAILALRQTTHDGRFDTALKSMSRYVLHQLQPGGEFIHDRAYPSGNIQSDISLSASALAVHTLVELYEATARPVFMTAAKRGMDGLIASDVEGRGMAELPHDEWFLSAVDSLFTYTRDASLVRLVERVALSIVSTQTQTPDFPDLLGSVNQHPSATTAARRTRALARAAELLLDTGRDQAAEGLLGQIRLSLAFQLQAQLDPPSAMYLSRPDAYIGAFRDHVLDYGLTLHCQYTQILSLLDVAAAVEKLPSRALPDPPKVRACSDTTWDSMDRFPRFLPRRSTRPARTNP